MSKKNIRILALGFFVSGVILLLSSLLTPSDQSASGQVEEVEGLNSEITYLEEKIAQLEVAQSIQAEETEQPVESEDNDENIEETESNEEQQAEDEESAEESIITTTVTIEEGQPSSVATQQLESEKIIEDRFEFDSFLEDNEYAPLVRPGSYEITSEMSYEEIAQVLMGR